MTFKNLLIVYLVVLQILTIECNPSVEIGEHLFLIELESYLNDSGHMLIFWYIIYMLAEMVKISD